MNNTIQYKIPLGTASKANRRYKVLKHMLRDVISRLRATRRFDDANTIYMWQKGSGFRIKQCYPWTIYLDADEWKALSRGLRALGEKSQPADSMYQWLNKHRERSL